MPDDHTIRDRPSFTPGISPLPDQLDMKKYPPKTVIALSGGSIKGCFEAGALYYMSQFWDRLNLVGVVGTSTGAVNALTISSLGSVAAKELVEFYLKVTKWEDFFSERPWYQELKKLLKDIGIEIDLIDMKTSIDKFTIDTKDNIFRGIFATLAKNILPNAGPFTLIGSKLFFFLDMLGSWLSEKNKWETIEEVVELLQKGDGLLDLKPCMDKLEKKISYGTVGAEIGLRMYMVKYQDGNLYYMNQQGHIFNKYGERQNLYDFEDKEDLLKLGVKASTSIPFFFPAVGIRLKPDENGMKLYDYFVDGGVRENLPLKGAKELADQRGASRIISIVCKPHKPSEIKYIALDPTTLNVVNKPPAILKNLLRVLEIFESESLENEIIPPYGFNYPDGFQKIDIHAEINILDGFMLDPGLIRITIDDGYMAAWDSMNLYWGNISEEKYEVLKELRAEITELRKEIWELEHNKLIATTPTNTPDTSAYSLNIEVLKKIRDHKKELLNLAKTRFEEHLGAERQFYTIPFKIVGHKDDLSLQTSVHDWWEKWEKHAWSPRHQILSNSSPWDEFISPPFTLPAEESPPIDFGLILEEYQDGSN